MSNAASLGRIMSAIDVLEGELRALQPRLGNCASTVALRVARGQACLRAGREELRIAIRIGADPVIDQPAARP